MSALPSVQDPTSLSCAQMVLRQMDEAVSKVVAEVNTLLQVEEMSNMNNIVRAAMQARAERLLTDLPHGLQVGHAPRRAVASAGHARR